MSPKLKRVLRFSVGAGIAVGVCLQLVPVKGVGSNPTERYAFPAPREVEAVMRRACFDCHTNETKWPLYSRLAPGSWLMARDVNNGRKHLNFSEWADTDEEERALDFENCWTQVESGEMPPWFYIFPMHPKARLSDADKAVLKSWLLKQKSDNDRAKAAPVANENAPAVATTGDPKTANGKVKGGGVGKVGEAGEKVATPGETAAATAKP